MKRVYGITFIMLLVLQHPALSQAQRKEPSSTQGQAAGKRLAPIKRMGHATVTLFHHGSQNQLSVETTELRLRGDFDNGIILIPNFSVFGKKVVAPAFINLEFISYSDQRRFSVNRKLQIYADDELLYTATVTLSSSGKAANGTITEVLSNNLPYHQFLRLIQAKTAKITLGGMTLEVDEEKLDSLRDMKKCIDSSISFP